MGQDRHAEKAMKLVKFMDLLIKWIKN